MKLILYTYLSETAFDELLASVPVLKDLFAILDRVIFLPSFRFDSFEHSELTVDRSLLPDGT